MHHCHGHHAACPTDTCHAADEFTQAATSERRARNAHAHVAHSLLAIVGGLVLFHIVKFAHRGRR